MKIAMTHVDLPNESRGGVAFQAHYLANTLVKRGHDVTMFTFSPPYEECHYKVHQYPIYSSLKKLRLQAFIFALQLANTDFSKFDIVHTHGDNYLLWRWHRQVRTFHGSAKDEAQSATRLRRRLYQTVMIPLEQLGTWTAKVNVGVSQTTKTRIPGISRIIHCGVDITHFTPGKKNDRPAILFVGTIGGRKRGSFLAEVFTQEVKPCFPDAELWTVTEKPIEGEGIINFGKVSLDILCDLYRRAWVFCLPSTYEGFGVPYIEAMASGTPVVATPNPGAREVLEEGKYGVIVKDNDLGQQICCLLSDKNLRKAYVDRGLLRAQDYSWERVAKEYENLYTEFTL